jgi:hypothetical protein
VFPNPESVKRTAEFWLTNVDRLNGRNWWPKPVIMQVVVDASGVGFEGYLRVGGQQLPFTGTFTKEQALSSSTAREVRGYAAALAIAAQQFPLILTKSAILIEGDNQEAIAAINTMRSPTEEINEILKGIFEICTELRADVIGKWIPRGELTEADALSREPDAADWDISVEVYDSACRFFGCVPSVDMFASHAHHTADRFVSQFYAPGCLAVDSLRLNWSQLIRAGEVVLVFPPLRRVSTAITLIERYRTEALLCVPVKLGSNQIIQLRQMKAAIVSQSFPVPRQSSSCNPSGRVLKGAINPAFLELGIMHITWD